MKKLIMYLLIIISLCISVSALEVCEYEQDPFSACLIVTPAGMSCSTYNLIAPDNSTNISDGVMGVVNADLGIYSANFNQSTPGGWIVQLCDNSTAQINIKTTDETDLATIISNQEVFQTNISDQTDSIDIMINNSRAIENETRNQIINLQGDYNGSIPGMLDQQAAIDNLTRTQIIELQIANNASIPGMLSIQAEEDNLTRTWLGELIQGVNNTLTFNVLPLLLNNVFGLEAIANLVNALNDITAADVWNFEEKNLTSLNVGDQIIATQTNITDLNNSISVILNETGIALAVLEYTDLANKTIVYNQAWDLTNVTTTYDDLGYEIVETYIYNDTINKWYLNSTETRRVT